MHSTYLEKYLPAYERGSGAQIFTFAVMDLSDWSKAQGVLSAAVSFLKQDVYNGLWQIICLITSDLCTSFSTMSMCSKGLFVISLNACRTDLKENT